MTSRKQQKSPIFSHQFQHQDVEIASKVPRYEGFFRIDELTLRHRLFNGGYSKALSREIFERGDAVVLMLYDPQHDALVFIEQFRAGALQREHSPWLLEFVAGMFGADENPLEVAVREAKEEANIDVKPDAIQPVLEYLSSPGGTTEKIHLYIACIDSSQVQGVHGLESEGEDILLHVISRAEAMQLLAAGKINNAATIIGLQWLALNHQQFSAR